MSVSRLLSRKSSIARAIMTFKAKQLNIDSAFHTSTLSPLPLKDFCNVDYYALKLSGLRALRFPAEALKYCNISSLFFLFLHFCMQPRAMTTMNK